jgi:phage tail-like protein
VPEDNEPDDTSGQEPEEPPGEAEEEILDALAGLRLEDAPAPPPPEEPPTSPAKPGELPFDQWVGMPLDRSRWLQHLPWIYSEHPFLGRYLLIFEDLFGPLDQAIAHFDLVLNPRTAPESYLSVLANWLGLVLDDRWPVDQRRAILRSAVELYDFRGTKKGMIQLLEACTRCVVEITEDVEGPHSFRVTLSPQKGQEIDEGMIRYLVETNKPAHTVYTLQIHPIDDGGQAG